MASFYFLFFRNEICCPRKRTGLDFSFFPLKKKRLYFGYLRRRILTEFGTLQSIRQVVHMLFSVYITKESNEL